MNTTHTIAGLAITMCSAVTDTVAPALAALTMCVFLAACVYVSNRR